MIVCTVHGSEALEEVLRLTEKSEKVDQCKKMLKEMWRMGRGELSSCSDVR